MKRLALALALVAVTGAAHAVTLFDSIYSDAAQTAARPFSASGTTKILFANHLTAGFFTLGEAASLTDVSFLYANRTTTPVPGSFTGTVQIYRTIDPGLITYNSTATSTTPAFSDPIFSTTFTQASTVGANALGTGGFTLSTPLDLEASHTYAFVIKINSANVVPVPTYNGAYGAGSGLAGFNKIPYDFDGKGFIAISDVVSFGPNSSPNTSQNLGFALYSNPVPEPATLAALGFGAIALLRRRKRA